MFQNPGDRAGRVRRKTLTANVSGRADKAFGSRGPLFVWADPTPASLAAGQNAGAQIYVGTNPGASPAVNDPVAASIFISNENGRGSIWGLNVVAVQQGASAGADGLVRAAELETCTVNSEQTDPFATSGNARKTGIELVAHGSSALRGTAANWVWSANATNSKWWSVGLALSRVKDSGIVFGTWTGDTDTNNFQTAAIYDKSGSANVLKVDGNHATSIINLSGITTFGDFVRGLSGGATNLPFRNAADYSMAITIDSGTSAGQGSSLVLADRQNGKWSLVKDGGNNFSIQNVALGTSPLAINGTTDVVALTRALDLSASTAGQIVFPASPNRSSNANTLDDYEEGTWSPVMTFGGSSTSVAYVTQNGTYVKVGKTVTVTAHVALSNNGTGTGAAVITGLPFTSQNVDASTIGELHAVSAFSGLVAGGGCRGVIGGNLSTVALFTNSTTGGTALTDTNVTNTADFHFSATYIAGA